MELSTPQKVIGILSAFAAISATGATLTWKAAIKVAQVDKNQAGVEKNASDIHTQQEILEKLTKIHEAQETAEQASEKREREMCSSGAATQKFCDSRGYPRSGE